LIGIIRHIVFFLHIVVEVAVKLTKKEELDDREAEWGGYHHHLLMDGHLIIHMEVYVDSLLCLIHHVVFFLKEDIIEVEVAVKLTKKNTREE
jgi:hypothetical protein